MIFISSRFKTLARLLCISYFLLLGITGCSTSSHLAKKPTSTQTIEERNTQLQQLKHWQIKGKIAFIEQNNRNSASLYWMVNEEKQNQKLNLTTYLGINLLQVTTNNGIHTIEVNGETYQGKNLTQLIQKITQLTLPTDALSSWLKGVSYHSSDNIIYHDETSLPLKLTSNYNGEDWEIAYGQYRYYQHNETNTSLVENISLATKFTIKQNDLLIKIHIKDWTL